MSSRTAGRARAIRAAWKNERRLVLEGKGTRDWTEEQQRQIAEKGKAYDDRGLAFEGQHMKNVATYPEYHDDPQNIQLLSHDEHLAAHGGNFHNPTNGFYDPVSKTMTDFGYGPPEPCAEMILTNPIFASLSDASTTQPPSAEIKNGTLRPSRADPAPDPHRRATPAARPSKSRFVQRTQAGWHVAQQWWTNLDPSVKAEMIVSVVAFAGKVAVEASRSGSSAGRDRAGAPSTQPSSAVPTGSGIDSRQSPAEHGVSAYIRKDGTNVRSYQRGGKKD